MIHHSTISVNDTTPGLLDCVISDSVVPDKIFPDCLAKSPSARQIDQLIAALDISDKNQYVAAIGMTRSITLSGNGLKKNGTDLVADGSIYSHQKLLEISKEQDLTWFPNPVDPSHYGRSSAHVARYTTIVVENDELSLQDQWKQIQWLGSKGLAPTSVLYTGGKSLHIYFRLTQDCTADEYLSAKKALVMMLGADTAVSAVEKSRLPGFYRPNKEYPQQLVYNTGRKTDICHISRVFLSLYGRDITNDLWTEYKLSRTGKSHLAPQAVLTTPDNQLPTVVYRREQEKQAEIRKKYRLDNPTNIDCGDYFQACKDAIKRIDEGATKEDFVALGFNIKREYPGYTMGSFGTDGKGTSVKLSVHDGRLIAYSFNDYLVGTSLSATYSQLWFSRNGYTDTRGAHFFKSVEALCESMGVRLPARNIPQQLLIKSQTNQTVIPDKILPGTVSKLPDVDITVIATPMGSGKTRVAAREYRDMADGMGVPFVYLSMLVSLAAGASRDIGIPDAKDYAWGDTHVAGCIHSFRESSALGARLMPILDEAIWTGCRPIIFIDEVKAVVERLICTDTNLINERREIIDALIKYLPFCKLVVADAQSDDFSINLLKQLIEYGSYRDREVTVHWLVSNKPTKLDQVYVFPQTNVDLKKTPPGTLLAVLIEDIRNNGGFHLLNVTGQQVTSKTGINSTRVIAQTLEKKGIKTLVIDRETVADGGLAGDFMGNPTGTAHHAKQLGYQVIIASPIIKTGVSMVDLDPDKPLFRGVWSIETGLSTPDMVEQNQLRYRNLTVPRYLLVAQNGFNFIANKATQASKIKHHERATADKVWDLYQYELTNDNDTAVTHFMLDAHCEIAARINREMLDYRVEVLKRINQLAINVSYELPDFSGFNILASSGKEIKSLQRDNYELVLEEEHKEICVARDLTRDEYAQLKKERTSNRIDSRAIKKYEITRTTGKEVIPDHIHNTETGFYRALGAYYAASKGFMFQSLKDKSGISKQINRDITRENRSIRLPRVIFDRSLLELLQPLLDKNRLSNNDADVISFIERLEEKGLVTRVEGLVLTTDYEPLRREKESLSLIKKDRERIREEERRAKTEIAALRQTKKDEIAKIRARYTDIISTAQKNEISELRLAQKNEIIAGLSHVALIGLQKQEINNSLTEKKQGLDAIRSNLTKKYQTRQFYRFDGELGHFHGDFQAQSPIEILDKIITYFGFKIVKAGRIGKDRVYDIRSGYTDKKGNYPHKPGDVHPQLIDHWYKRDMVNAISDLLSDLNNRVRISDQEIDYWLSSGDPRLQPLTNPDQKN